MINATRKELIEIFVTLNELSEKGNQTFKYAISKNLKAIEKLIEPLLYIEAGIDNLLKDYREDYKKIIKEFGKINRETGKSEVDITGENGIIVTKSIDALNESYKGILDNYAEQEKKYRELLSAETSFDFKMHQVSLINIPEDITKDQINNLINFNLIKEEEEE